MNIFTARGIRNETPPLTQRKRKGIWVSSSRQKPKSLAQTQKATSKGSNHSFEDDEKNSSKFQQLKFYFQRKRPNDKGKKKQKFDVTVRRKTLSLNKTTTEREQKNKIMLPHENANIRNIKEKARNEDSEHIVYSMKVNACNYLKMIKDRKSQKQVKKMERKDRQNNISAIDEEGINRYQILNELGKGAYGVVRMGINRETKRKVAIKIYDKQELNQAKKMQNIERQINILSMINHKGIAKLIEVCETQKYMFLVEEYGGANSLYKYLVSLPGYKIPENTVKIYFRSIAETVGYLHERDIVHRDIKAENILLNRYQELKLIDFGFSLLTVPPATIDTFCGTPTYMAPEIVSKKDHVPIYTDIWSMGVLLYVMLQGNYPFRGKNEDELFQKIKQANVSFLHGGISQNAKNLITIMLQQNPLNRPTIKEILAHSFFK